MTKGRQRKEGEKEGRGGRTKTRKAGDGRKEGRKEERKEGG